MAKSNLIQFLNNAAIFASAIFIPVMAKEFGASPFEIGLAVGIFNLTYFASNYLFGIMADRFCIRRMVQYGLLLSAGCFLAQLWMTDLFSLLWVRALAGAAAGTFPAALAVYAYEEREGRMGLFNAYTSLGWAFGSVVAGLLGAYNVIFLLSAVMLLTSYLSSLSLKDICQERGSSLFPFRLIRKNFRIYFPYFMRAIGAQAVWSVFPLFLIALGADKMLIGVTYFLNLGSQFFIMQHVERFRNLYLVNIGLLTSVMVFVLYAAAPTIWVVLPVQLLLGASFSTLQVGTQQELLKENREKASVISILNAIVNFTAIVGPLLAGCLLNYWDFSVLMWLAAACAFIGLISFTKVLE
jgi:MFS family permease